MFSSVPHEVSLLVEVLTTLKMLEDGVAIVQLATVSGMGNCSELGGGHYKFKFSGHNFYGKIYIPIQSDNQNWGAQASLARAPLFPTPMNLQLHSYSNREMIKCICDWACNNRAYLHKLHIFRKWHFSWSLIGYDN